jgi:hypothetical protein
MAIQLFGFEIGRKKQQDKDEQSKTFALPPNDDGAVTIQSGAYYGTYVDLDGTVRNEVELITRYREMSMQPELETAIDEIVNEAIVQDDDGKAVEINDDNLKQNAAIKKKIQEEFNYILKLLNFGNMGHDIFRRWYIDGRMFYHIVIDEKSPNKGIQELRYIDPRRIRKIREIQKVKEPGSGMEVIKRINEYYLYNERGIIGMHSNLGTKIAVDSVVNVNSGLMDAKRSMVLSYLHKAIKPLNQLRMVEDAVVIYRLSRAPERRVFYVDVGNMPTVKAEQYLRDIMVKYRNKLVYDSNTGEIKDDRKHLSMLEDFWLPRREGSRGTEITTLQGGQNLGELEDVKYFEKKLYKALGVPVSRLEQQQGFSLGRSTEVTRDELKFNKFVQRLRSKFSTLFDDLLRVQLVLKKVCSEDEWNKFKEEIWYDFKKDNNFTELKEAELLQNRLSVLQLIDPYVGRYYSMEWVRKKVLMMDDEEIEEVAQQIEDEKAADMPVDDQGNPLPTDDQGNPLPQQATAPMPNIVPPTPTENMMQQYVAQQGVPPEEMPVQDGTGKDQMDPLEMGADAQQMRNRQRFINDTLEPVR